MEFKENLRVLPVGALLLGLSWYSYHVRELLVCWLYFSMLFVCIVLVVLFGELGVHAGPCAAVWARSTTGITTVLALASAKPSLKIVLHARELK